LELDLATAATATDVLASFASSLEYDDLPVTVRDRVKDVLLDTVASALAGNVGDEVAQIGTLARMVGGPAIEATVIGGAPSSYVGAALLNGYLITAATVCDVHRPTLFHVTPEVVPPAMAAAERVGASGRQFITAVAAGFEVATRIGVGINYPAFRARGWHSPGVIGPFGGATSAGRILGLDATRMRNALGLAGSQSAGTFAHWGTPTIKFHQSRGSLSGLIAASLAETGFEAAADILTAADGGLYRAYSDGGNEAAVTERLGERWELMNISLRRWPVASSIQSMVTALFSILESHPVSPAEIDSVRIGLSETVFKMHGELGWDTRFRALLSTRYVASVIVHDRRCWLDQFTPTRIADADLDSFARTRIQVEIDADLPTNAAVVRLSTTAGTTYEDRRDVPKGDAMDPLSRQEIIEKLRDGSQGILAPATVDRLVDSVDGLETIHDVRPVLRELRAFGSG
jgi:2-methylcitrate dehydratase PrpD